MATPTRLYGPTQLGSSAATIYTAPAGGAIIKHMRVSNPSGSSVPFTLSIGADAAGNRLYDAVEIGPGGSLERFVYYVLNNADVLQSFAGTASVLVLILDGSEGA